MRLKYEPRGGLWFGQNAKDCMLGKSAGDSMLGQNAEDCMLRQNAGDCMLGQSAGDSILFAFISCGKPYSWSLLT
jgi:hypothetical protein